MMRTSFSRVTLSCLLVTFGVCLMLWAGLVAVRLPVADSAVIKIKSPEIASNDFDTISEELPKEIEADNTGQQEKGPVLSAKFSLPSRCTKDQLRDRQTTLRNWCANNGFPIKPPMKHTLNLYRNLDEIYVNDEYKVLYCHIPKTGCTNWKKYFILLSGKTNFTEVHQIEGDEAHSTMFKTSVRNLSSYSDNQKLKIINTYFKFVIVRHPLTRLLSAYRNKFGKINHTFQYFTDKILRFNGHPPKHPKEQRATLTEFLQFVTDPEGLNIHMNEHWQSFHSLCHPCYINYDYIGKVETMSQDAKEIISKIGSKFTYPEKVSSSDRYVEESFSKISQNLTKRVLSKYIDDVEAFGYNC